MNDSQFLRFVVFMTILKRILVILKMDDQRSPMIHRALFLTSSPNGEKVETSISYT